jgi:hypothetical protein
VLTPRKEKGYGDCPNFPGTPPADVVYRPDRYNDLSEDGRLLIQRWARQARAALARPNSRSGNENHRKKPSITSSFEAFIFAWISFNGWASRCLESEDDVKLVNVLSVEPSLSDTFAQLVNSNVQVRQSLDEFSSQWPIFRTADVRGVALPQESRAERVERYVLQRPTALREPRCHLRHDDGGPPADWGHTLRTIYRVRCNLFHGTKSAYGAEDREIVGSAAGVLVPVVCHLVLRE